MVLKGIPDSVTPELLYALARMGHGDYVVIADANFPSDSVANSCVISHPIRVHGQTSSILQDILKLMPLDKYVESPLAVMDRVPSDKVSNLHVPAYENIATAAGVTAGSLNYIDRFLFYEMAKKAFVVVQTDDRSLYANVIVYKGVL